jgi:hypothetical protein
MFPALSVELCTGRQRAVAIILRVKRFLNTVVKKALLN